VNSYFADDDDKDIAGASAAAEPAYTGPRTLDGRPAPQSYQRSARGAASQPKRKGVATLGSLGGSSSHHHDDDDEDTYGSHGAGGALGLRLGDSGFAAGIRDDDEYTESFATPNEDSRDYNTFEDEQDLGLKTAARALSLSRLTLATAPSATLNQIPPQAI